MEKKKIKDVKRIGDTMELLNKKIAHLSGKVVYEKAQAKEYLKTCDETNARLCVSRAMCHKKDLDKSMAQLRLLLLYI